MSGSNRAKSWHGVPSPLRHDLRNRFAAIRNSVFYIQRSLSSMGFLEHDQRVPRFLGLIEAELQAADRLLDTPRAEASSDDATEETVRRAGTNSSGPTARPPALNKMKERRK